MTNLKLNLKIIIKSKDIENNIYINTKSKIELDKSKVLSKITEYIYLSDYSIASNINLLQSTGITHIVNCAIEHHNMHQNYENFKSLQLNLIDNPNQSIDESFQKVIDFIDQAKNENGVVLVFCHKGISRSASFVILYIMYSLKIPFKQAYSFVQNQRSIVSPNIGFYNALLKYSNLNGLENQQHHQQYSTLSPLLSSQQQDNSNNNINNEIIRNDHNDNNNNNNNKIINNNIFTVNLI